MNGPGKPPSQGSSGQPPAPTYYSTHRRTIRTAVGPEAAAVVFANSYIANVRQGVDHLSALQRAHEAVEKFLDVLDQEIIPGQSV